MSGCQSAGGRVRGIAELEAAARSTYHQLPLPCVCVCVCKSSKERREVMIVCSATDWFATL